MFIVFNKQKIYSYLVALSTVVILFMIAFAVTNNSNDVLQTSTNMQQENVKSNSIVLEKENQIIRNDNNIIRNENIINKIDN